jgi:pimeloyl-ACP methyl ester carboxylesterase
MTLAFTEQWRDIEGYRLRIHTHTPSSQHFAMPLVMLHEGLGCIEFWRDLPAELAEHLQRPVLVYDRRGYGRSSPCDTPRGTDYLHVEAYTHLPALLNTVGIQKALLIGHSDGGSIALLFAARFPHHCAGVVSEAAHIFVDETTLAGIRKAVKAYRGGDLRERLARYHGAQTDAVFGAWADTWLAPWFRSWSIERDIQDAACPVLAIQGAKDPYGETAQVEGIAAAVSGPAHVLILPDCGHTPHNENRKAWTAAVTDFVAGLPCQ